MAEKCTKQKNTKERKQLLNLLCSLGDHSRLVCSVQCIRVCVVFVCVCMRAHTQKGGTGKMVLMVKCWLLKPEDLDLNPLSPR